MKYTVVWGPAALNELANLWNQAQDREVASASNAIDAILKFSPYGNSESREGNLRILFVPLLAVLFEVSDQDCLVTVRAVWRPS